MTLEDRVDALERRVTRYHTATMALVTLIALVALLSAPMVVAEGASTEWDILNDEVKEPYRAGQYARAVVVGKQALRVAEDSVGPDHPYVAASLSSLASLYDVQGHYAEVEPLYKRALKINEKALGPDHTSVATSLINLASLYRATGRILEAQQLEKRAGLSDKSQE